MAISLIFPDVLFGIDGFRVVQAGLKKCILQTITFASQDSLCALSPLSHTRLFHIYLWRFGGGAWGRPGSQ